MIRAITLLFLCFSVTSSFAQSTLLSWEFGGYTGSEVTGTADMVGTGISSTLPSGVISRGAGLNAAGNSGRFNANNWSLLTAPDLTGDDYMLFTIEPASGFSMSLNQIDFNWQSSGTGPSAVVFTSSLDGHTSVIGSAFTGLGSTNNGLSLSLPAGTFSNLTGPVTFRVYGYNATSTGGTGGFEGSGADLVIDGATTPLFATITTGSIGQDAFCLSGGGSVNISVPYSITGSFNPGNAFTAELSDANGDFTSPTIIGSVAAIAGGSISATIPGLTTAGSGYRIRVVADNPATTGSDNGSDLAVVTAIPGITNALVAAGNGEITLSWDLPVACADHVVVLASEGVGVDATVSQANLDGLLNFEDYIANPAWDLRSDANDIYDLSLNLLGTDNQAYVMLADAATTNSLTVTGLTNEATYHFRVFLLYNTNEYGPAVDLSGAPTDVCGKRLLITEYVEGSGQDKCIEIFNADDVTVNLSNYELSVYSNGSTSAGLNIPLDNVNLAPGDVYVVCNGSAGATFLAQADQTSIISHNGNDAIAISCPFDGSNLDVFGKIGDDPGTAGWIGSVSGCGTANQIWRRNPALGSALSGTEPAFDPDGLYLCVGSIADASDLGLFSASFPVELLDLQGTFTAGRIQLSWTTTMELGNDRFELHKTVRPGETELVTTLAGAGFSDVPVFYQATDYEPLAGANHYQLAQVDLDGTRRVAGNVEVLVREEQLTRMQVFPNPVLDEMTLSAPAFADETIDVRIYTVEGKLVMRGQFISGTGQFHLNTSLLSPGLYFVEASGSSHTARTSFVK